MKKMKGMWTTRRLFLIALICMGLQACDRTPSGVVRRYTKEVVNPDKVEHALRKYTLFDETKIQETVSRMQRQAEEGDDASQRLQGVDVLDETISEDGEHAEVQVVEHCQMDKDANPIDLKYRFVLKRVDGCWVIDKIDVAR